MENRFGARPRAGRDAPAFEGLLAGASPVLIGARQQSGPRRFSARHAELLHDPELHDAGARAGRWSARALWACLEHLRVSTVTAAARVEVVDAWTDGAEAICVVYHPPFDETRVVGLRRCRSEAVEAQEWRLGDTTAWGYDLGPAHAIDPVAFGWNVADFDLGEPLGFVATTLRHDRGDVGWWGTLEDELPQPPHA